MKILVTAKRVEDPESKIKVKPDGSGIVQEGLKYKINPFDEIAVEEALRLTAKFPGDVVAVSIGGKEVHEQLRHALAMGATKAVWVNHEGPLDQMGVAAVLQKVVEKEKPDLVLMGKQAVDGDSNQVGQRLAELLDWPMATFAATIREEQGALLVGREVDCGVLTLRVRLPAVVTVDLRIVAPTSVFSLHTDAAAHKYGEGVRFAPLPAIMAAKKKPLDTKTLAELAPGVALTTKTLK